MFGIVFLMILIVPIVEIFIIVQVGQVLGGFETIGLVILISLVGAWMVRREGLGLIFRIQQRLSAGESPTAEIVDGLLVAIAGALMLTPGFLTDSVGLLLLFFPTRVVVRKALIRRFRSRVFGTMGTTTHVVDVGEVRHQPPDDESGPQITSGS